MCVCGHIVSVCGIFPPPHRSVSLQSHVKSLFTSVCLRPALSPWRRGNPVPITPSAPPFHSNPVTPPTIRGSKQRENEWVWGGFPCMEGNPRDTLHNLIMAGKGKGGWMCLRDIQYTVCTARKIFSQTFKKHIVLHQNQKIRHYNLATFEHINSLYDTRTQTWV